MSATNSDDDIVGQPTGEQAAAFKVSQADRDQTLEAIHRLERALGAAAPGREADWLDHVATALSELGSAMSSEREESLRSDSLLSMIGRDYPRRFGSRVRQLRDQHDDIAQHVASLSGQLTKLKQENIDFADIRQRLAWVVRAIHHRRAREGDLVFEAFRLDLGGAGSSSTAREA